MSPGPTPRLPAKITAALVCLASVLIAAASLTAAAQDSTPASSSEENARANRKAVLERHRPGFRANRIVFFAPDIPAKKLRGAIKSYAEGVRPQEVLALVDNTVLGGAGAGVLVTADMVYAYQELRSPVRYPLRPNLNVVHAPGLIYEGLKLNDWGITFRELDRDGAQRLALMLGEMAAQTGAVSVTSAEQSPSGTAELKARVGGIVDRYRARMTHPGVHLAPAIPLKKIAGAVEGYARDAGPEEVIALFDNTLFGSADRGLLLTPRKLYVQPSGQDFRSHELDQPLNVQFVKGRMGVGWMNVDGREVVFGDNSSAQAFVEMLAEISALRRGPNDTKQAAALALPAAVQPEVRSMSPAPTAAIGAGGSDPAMSVAARPPPPASASALSRPAPVDPTQRFAAAVDAHRTRVRHPNVHLSPGLPAAKVAAATFAYARDASPAEVLALIDESHGGNGGSGLLLTSRALHVGSAWQEPRRFELGKPLNVEFLDGVLLGWIKLDGWEFPVVADSASTRAFSAMLRDVIAIAQGGAAPRAATAAPAPPSAASTQATASEGAEPALRFDARQVLDKLDRTPLAERESLMERVEQEAQKLRAGPTQLATCRASVRFRIAELLEREADTNAAALAYLRARELAAGGRLLRGTSNGWEETDSVPAVAAAYLRLNNAAFAYQATAWLVGVTAKLGLSGLEANLWFIGVALPLVWLPLLFRAPMPLAFAVQMTNLFLAMTLMRHLRFLFRLEESTLWDPAYAGGSVFVPMTLMGVVFASFAAHVHLWNVEGQAKKPAADGHAATTASAVWFFAMLCGGGAAALGAALGFFARGMADAWDAFDVAGLRAAGVPSVMINVVGLSIVAQLRRKGKLHHRGVKKLPSLRTPRVALSLTPPQAPSKTQPGAAEQLCPHGHGSLRLWSGKPRCWECGWQPETRGTPASQKTRSKAMHTHGSASRASQAKAPLTGPASAPCPNGHGPLRAWWYGKPRCSECGWPERQFAARAGVAAPKPQPKAMGVPSRHGRRGNRGRA